MKLNKLISAFIIGASFTSTLYAAPFFQAGNILDGQKVEIGSGSGVASYYAEGKSGKIVFSCKLESDDKKAEALLMNGKNFDNKYSIGGLLKEGSNGPFTWTLTDEGENVGNIKVWYIKGSKVSVQCQGYKA